MNEHDLVKALKDLTAELGRTPTRAEFEAKCRGTRYALTKMFGTYTALKKAAGLDDSFTNKERRIDNSVFERSLESHFEGYTPAPLVRRTWPSIATLSDTHFPFSNATVIDRFIEYVGDAKPEWLVLAGDIWDFLSHSKFARSHNIFSPREEREMCIKMNTELWAKLKAASPKSKCFQLVGNHEARPLKRVLEEYPAAEDWVQEMMKRDLTFQGVTTILDPREFLPIADDIIVMHGFKTQAGSHRDMSLQNVISGHSHRGSVTYRRLMDKTIWELNCGFAGDPAGKGLTYTASKIPEWTPGFGVVNAFGPQFVSL